MSAKLKQKSAHALLLVFILASILFLKPDATVDHDTGFVSSELEVREIVERNVTSTSYVNSDGIITDAIDMGYATVQRTRNSAGQVIEEFYLDAAGNPVERYGDYYGIAYEYNDGDTVIRYLGADKKPMMLSSGYSAIVRTLVEGKATDDFYYDLNMQPVQCTGGYYGLHREYDEQGLNCAITYLDDMAKHAHPEQVPDTPDEWLENFNTFSIYQILPQLIELWGLNVQTEVEARKNLAKVSG